MKGHVSRLTAVAGSLTADSPMNDPMNDPAWELVGFALNTKYEDLPSEVIDYAKKLILDTLGIAVGGSSAGTISGLVEIVRGWGGREESTLLVYGGKVPAPNAAFAIGPMTRALDMGDTHPEAAHLSEHIVPVLLAALGLKSPITGKCLLTAFVVAAEVGARVGEASFAVSTGFKNPTASDLWAPRHPNCAALGSVLGAARMLNLDEKTAHAALSIQSWAVGAHSADLQGNLMMRYQHAFLCQSAINAVLLAQQGVTGPANIFSGPTGYLAAFHPWKNDISLLTKGLGTKWSFADTYLKAYTGCFFTHGPVTAMDNLRKEYAIKPNNVVAIEVTQSVGGYHAVSARKECWNPQNMTQAQFSMPYTLATMAINGTVFVSDFTSRALARSDVRQLMKKIKVKVDEQLSPDFAAVVKVILKDGTEYTNRVEHPKGHPVISPMTWDDVIQKFRACVALSAKPIPDANTLLAIQTIQNLERSEDVTKLVELLTP